MLQFNNRQEYEKYLKKYYKRWNKVYQIWMNRNILLELSEEYGEIQKAGFELHLKEVLEELNIKEPVNES